MSAHTHGRRHLEPLLRPTPQVNCTFSQPTKEVPREWPLLGHLFLTRSWPLVATLANPKIQPSGEKHNGKGNAVGGTYANCAELTSKPHTRAA